ncbi:MAG: diphthamide biosynthesis enzyme Dph2 [Methanobacteriota archaeon]
MYDFEETSVKEFLKRTRAKRVAIQMPAGLVKYLEEIEKVFTDMGVETVVLANGCYGACDLADDMAKKLGCNALVHYGHADLGLKSCLPTLYVEARVKMSPLDSVKLAMPGLKFKRVGLVSTVQYVGHLQEVAKFLNSQGIQTLVGKKGYRLKYPGQVLGCDVGCAKAVASVVDGFVYVGTGDFHPLGVALATGKQVVAVNPISNRFKVFAPNQGGFIGKRKAMVAKAALGKKFGVVVSTKTGQARFNLAKKLVELLRQNGREAHLLAVDEFSPETIGNFDFEAFVCVACPRIPIDDAERFERPMLTPFEVEAMVGKVPIEPYRIDEVRMEDIG